MAPTTKSLKLSETMTDWLKYLGGFRGPGGCGTASTDAALVKRGLITPAEGSGQGWTVTPEGWAVLATLGVFPPQAPEPSPEPSPEPVPGMPTVQDLEAKLADLDAREAARYARADQNCDSEPHLGLSAWASGINRNLVQTQIGLAKRGWVSEFPALFKLDGTPVKAFTFVNNWGKLTWRIEDGQGLPMFVTDGPVALKREGLRVESVTRPAYARIAGGGKGLSGCASAFVAISEDRWRTRTRGP